MSEIIVHPDNDPSTFDYDVCILKLKRKLDFGALVKPIKLADSEKYYKTGTKSLVSGWGALQVGIPLNIRNVQVYLLV